jgi:signal transduction histidine kinase
MAVIGQFAAGIAHELNNPIGVIRGYLKTMKPTQPADMLKEELQILDEEAAACQRIGIPAGQLVAGAAGTKAGSR